MISTQQILKIIFIALLPISLFSQSVDCSRSAPLRGSTNYDMEGTAYVERFDNGTLQFRLGSDFSTDSGPDVQIFLSNDSTSVAGGLMIADIGSSGGLNHFSGEQVFSISGATIHAYDYVVFRCVQFNLYWGGGTLSQADCEDGGEMPVDTTDMNPDTTAVCLSSLVATTDWVAEVTVCPNDGISDPIPLRSTIEVDLGVNYSYLITDVNNNLTAVVNADTYDFEGSSLETEYVFGVYYQGNLQYTIGQPISSITASGCAELSGSAVFLTVTKENCATSHDCLETTTATTNWVDLVDICPSDGEADVILLVNNQALDPGDHYAYIITDTMRNVVDVTTNSFYDFEGSGEMTLRVYGVSYAGDLNYSVGSSIDNITADTCAVISDSNFYLTVTKGACPPPTEPVRSISGSIMTVAGDPIVGAQVSAGEFGLAMTDANGRYVIDSLPVDQEIIISAEYQDLAANGISSIDLVLVTRHILGIEPFQEPLQLIAADVNANQSISASDLVVMQRVLLDLDSEFSTQPSCQIIDAAQALDLNILRSGFSSTITIASGSDDLQAVNFIAIKTGDVNGSANP